MKILIINLDDKKDRLAFQKKQMKALGLEFERLPAFESGDISEQDYRKRGFSWERVMRKSEVACLASHERAWRLVAEASQPALILEDDAWLANTTPNVLQQLERITDVDHVTLENRSRKKLLSRQKRALGTKHNLLRLYQDRTGAAAYVLWPNGANKLLARSRSKPGLADALIAASYDLNSFQIEPAIAIQLDQAQAHGLTAPLESGTSIGTAATYKPPAENTVSALFFRFRRITAQLRMGARQLCVIGRAQRRFVTVETQDFQANI